ncbi:UvrD-helicase domain-containing protein [Kineosporia sp. A_224]|uniref:UvrD-helicase domain-containing protein n=1 Tax=Kineosporia sp. A_224 TaxID=1962180 RepID=UPI000B4B09BA|nr:UvrD-helicase domain-containing protein [Kineosporia sp. A_224]
MPPSDHRAKVADEEARNSRYIQRLREKGDVRIPIAVASSANWTQEGLPRTRAPRVEAVIGRVGLTERSDDIEDDSFYIGPWHSDKDGFQVFSWAAPVAAAFFGTGSYAPLEGRVQVTRVFQHRSLSVVDFDDERLDGGRGATAFDRTTRLTMPRPPRPGAAPWPSVATRQPERPPQQRPELIDLRSIQPSPGDVEHVIDVREPVFAAPAARRSAPVDGLRQEGALLKALAAPRRESLSHVLGTMQPDQYRLVTRPEDEPIVVQGYPGTGKTIVALHRAAYLVNPDRPDATPNLRVVLLGPTRNFVRHTRNALNSLTDAESVNVLSVLDLWHTIYPGLTADTEGAAEQYQDNALRLARLVDRAATLVDGQGALYTRRPEDGARNVYAMLREAGRKKTTRLAASWDDYLAALPEWDIARQHPRFHTLLTYCVLVAHRTMPDQFDHLVVDEAQDITPLGWHILKRLNRRGRWTIVGDINQRNTEWGIADWKKVAAFLDIDLQQPGAYQEFKASYRSTQGILTFANAILKDKTDQATAIQGDVDLPTVVKSTAADLPQEIVAAATGLTERHPHGTVAVIGTDATLLRQSFARAGWSASHGGSDEWVLDDARVRLLVPRDVRGLEFDGVVVVDPGLFPRSVDKEGPLYTSLTRANRELVLVHSRALPAKLRRVLVELTQLPGVPSANAAATR